MRGELVWDQKDFAVGYERLIKLEESLVISSKGTAEPLKQTARQIAQVVRIARLIADEMFEYNAQENVLSLIATLAADVLSPYGIAVTYEGFPVELSPEIALEKYESPLKRQFPGGRRHMIAQKLPLRHQLKYAWSHHRHCLPTVEEFQQVFTLVASQSPDPLVKEAASRIELVLRSGVAIIRGIQEGEQWFTHENLIANKLWNAIHRYNIGIDWQ